MYPLLALTLALAAPPSPPPPTVYDVQLRYRIPAVSEARVLAYRALVADLKKAGFTRTDLDVPTDESLDTDATRMNGTLPSPNVDKLLDVRGVRAVLLYPKGATFPEKGERVRAELWIGSGYLPNIQRRLRRQVAEVAAKANFVEAFGYDHRDETRLVGSVPVEELPKLLEDVRGLVPADKLDAPLRNIEAVRLVLVRPDWPAPIARRAEVPTPKGQEKFSADLRAAGAVSRLELILDKPPVGDGDWRASLEREGVLVEGRLGPVVTITAPLDAKGARGSLKEVAATLAQRPEVLSLRLPISGRTPALAARRFEPAKASGVAKLHALGRKGKGTRMAVIAADFAGWEKLPGDVTLLDLTAERSPDLQPDPAGDGSGTRDAAAILGAAPEAELTLVRIADTAAYQLETVARAINGEVGFSLAMSRRLRELNDDRAVLDQRRLDVAAERKRVLDNPSADEIGLQAQADYRKNQNAYDAAEKAYQGRFRRWVELGEGLKKLKGVRVVASTLVWTDGYPVNGTGALSRWLDDRPFKAALWFQAAGDSAGQAWTGPFRDADDNRFAEMGERKYLPPEAWTTEVNFLKPVAAGAKVRLSLQWREPQDALPVRAGEDPYREPLAKLRLVVAYQPDPKGAKRPADDLEVLALPSGSIQRLATAPGSSTYEYAVEFEAKAAGRYGVMIEGERPADIYAPGENVLPVGRKKGELHLRLFAKSLNGGRATWASFATRAGSVGTPADASSVFAVAGTAEDGSLSPSSAYGPPFGMGLLKKPELSAPDGGEGTGRAASVAAGISAATWSGKGSLSLLAESIRERAERAKR